MQRLVGDAEQRAIGHAQAIAVAAMVPLSISSAMARGLFRLVQRVVAAPDLAAARQHDALVDIVCVACAQSMSRSACFTSSAHARSLELPADGKFRMLERARCVAPFAGEVERGRWQRSGK